MLQCRDDVLSFTTKLVCKKSVVNTVGEKEIAAMLHSWIEDFPYFQQNPDQLIIEQTTGDDVERCNVMALVKGTKRASGRTVILMGHIDTVGIDDYNSLAELACKPDELRIAMQKEELPEAIRNHLGSDEWLFGRGALDMKSGVASHLYLLRYYSEHPEELAGNLVFLAECDEEDSSRGILSALKKLKAWKEQHELDYIAAINADFVAPRYPNDPNRYIYQGTIGKLLPAFYIVGAETHVGSSFEGLDPNLIASELTREIDYNPELCNEAFGETTAPPVTLKQTDLKTFYTVQTAIASYVYYNFLTFTWTPKDVLEKLKHHAKMAFDRAIELYKERYFRYCLNSGEPKREVTWRTRVITYEEMNRQLHNEYGSRYIEHMEQFKQCLLKDPSLDTRLFSLRVVEEAWKWMKDKSPAIVLFYSSLYSPRVELSGKNHKEQRLIDAVQAAVQMVQPHYGYPIIVKPFFPYISDMSFISISDDNESITAETANNPAWKSKIHVDYETIRQLDVPVINIGPYGLDAHKKYERVEVGYSMYIVPNLINTVIKYVIGS